MRPRSRKTKVELITDRVKQKASAAKRAKADFLLTIPFVVEAVLEMGRARRGAPTSWWGAWFIAWALAKAMHPIVKEIRRQAFGTTQPFKSAEAFRQWAGPHKLRPLTPLRRRVSGIPSPITPYHALLAGVREKVMPLTGWTERLALDHVALGRMYPGGFVGAGTHSSVAPPWAQVTFYPWHLNDEYFQHLRSALSTLLRTPLDERGERVGAWGKPYSLEDLKLLDLLAEEGVPPQSRGKGKAVGRTEYWRRLSVAWGERYKERVRPNALRMRWERFADTHPEDMRFF